MTQHHQSPEYACVIIGTGFSGLVMAIKLKEKGIDNFVILEKADGVGGTWRENTYPGAECDIPSALYSYSFEPYPHWEYKWSMQDQILEYIKYVVEKYDLARHIHFQEEVTGASWNNSKSHWVISTLKGLSYKAKCLVSAVGQLHYPSIPRFKGHDSFDGPVWHSAQWNHTCSLEGKKIGVIGNAASAVQFIPEITKEAKEVVIFQRSANWMLPKQDRAYKDWEKKLVARMPILLKIYRLKLWLLGGGLFFLMKKGNGFLRKQYQNQTISFIKKYIDDPEFIKALTPTYPMGAKRILFSDTYYPALANENVRLVTSEIKTINSSGIVDKEEIQHDLDVLIYSTGFKTNPFLMNIDIVGRENVLLKDHWKDGPKNYLGINIDRFPNFFMMYGPNTNLGHNSIILMSEAQAGYISSCIGSMRLQKLQSIEIKKEVINEYHKKTQERLENMIWASVEDSWYRSPNGNIPNNYPGRTMEYMRRTKKVDFSEYHTT